jgi:hypothetical protein
MVSTPYLELFLLASGEPGEARLESWRLLLGVGLVGEVVEHGICLGEGRQQAVGDCLGDQLAALPSPMPWQ